jgi:hypothetical protein
MDQLAFVQFPHPGSEHRPTGEVMPWNNRDHARKFLRGTGTYVRDGFAFDGAFTFWGEWEPPSFVERYSTASDGLPQWLHEPVWNEPARRKLLQNTDPLVFGDRFLYSNCRQTSVPSLRALARGSIVVFGSKLGKNWVVDTVFVVDDQALSYAGGEAASIQSDDMTRAVLFDRIATNPKTRRSAFSLYRGRSYADGADGPFSFVPCRPYAGGRPPRFSRPALALPPDRLTTNLAQGAKVTPASTTQLAEMWAEIVEQTVTKPGLAMAVKIDRPRIHHVVDDAGPDLFSS